MAARGRKSGPSKRNAISQLTSWKWLKENGDQIKIVFAVIAAFYALSEYKSKDYLDRVKNSADLMEKFYASESYKAITELDDMWLSAPIAKLRESVGAGKLTPVAYRAAVLERVKSDHNAEFMKAARGLKTVAICAIQGRCDASSLCMHLAQPIQDFRCNFREYILELSEHNSSCIIDEINHFADNYCKVWIGSYLGQASYESIKDNICLYDKAARKAKIGEKCVNSIVFKKNVNFFSRFVE